MEKKSSLNRKSIDDTNTIKAIHELYNEEAFLIHECYYSNDSKILNKILIGNKLEEIYRDYFSCEQPIAYYWTAYELLNAFGSMTTILGDTIEYNVHPWHQKDGTQAHFIINGKIIGK